MTKHGSICYRCYREFRALNWVSFVTLCHHQNANQLCHCQCQICCQSLSQFRYPHHTHRRRRSAIRPIDITFVQTVQSCGLQPLSSCKTPSKPLPLHSLATAHAGTFKMARQKDRNDQSRSQNTRSIYSLTAVRHHSNLHNASHNEAPRSRLVVSTCFAVIMGISPAHVGG